MSVNKDERKELLEVYWCRTAPMNYYGTEHNWYQTILTKFNALKCLFDAHDRLTEQEFNVYKNKSNKLSDGSNCVVMLHPRNLNLIQNLDMLDEVNMTIITKFLDISFVVRMEIEESLMVMYNDRYIININII